MLRASTLSDQVYEHLLRQISSGELSAGVALRELDLVAQLGVSRTPIREGLARLVEYGLVEVLPNRLTRVRRLAVTDIVQIYQVRKALEGLAIRLACGRLGPAEFDYLDGLAAQAVDAEAPQYDAACFRFDIELHRLIALHSGNPVLAAEIRKLHDLVQLVHKPVADRKGRLELERHQHLRIVAALKAVDPAACRQALLGHLRAASRFLVRCARQESPAAAGRSGKT